MAVLISTRLRALFVVCYQAAYTSAPLWYHVGLVVPEHESYPSDQSPHQNEVITSSTGRNTDEYLKILKRWDRIVNQLASAKCSGVLADKLHSTHFITDVIYEEALNVGPGVVETSRIRPVIGAVLAKVEMNTDNYCIFLAALLELGGLDDVLQLIEGKRLLLNNF